MAVYSGCWPVMMRAFTFRRVARSWVGGALAVGMAKGSEVEAEEEEEELMLGRLASSLVLEEGIWDMTREVELTVKGTGYPLPLWARGGGADPLEEEDLAGGKFIQRRGSQT